MTDDRTEPIQGEKEAALWRDQVRAPWMGSEGGGGRQGGKGAIVRLSWRPADLANVLSLIESMNVPLVLTGRIAAGAGSLRIDAQPSAQVAVIAQLRSSALVGHVIVLHADPAVKESVDVWGPMPDAVRVMQAIKQKLDPAGILNAGRGPI
jgi:hypothetical protein